MGDAGDIPTVRNGAFAALPDARLQERKRWKSAAPPALRHFTQSRSRAAGALRLRIAVMARVAAHCNSAAGIAAPDALRFAHPLASDGWRATAGQVAAGVGEGAAQQRL